jgi:TetR/AcrR family transcriptional regulator, lmrAB and yxaGH operons repressor
MTIIIVKGGIVAREVRARMIEGAVRLLAQHGLQATSFADVLELTGAPRGSIYHHFPEGKDQLISAAVDHTGAHALTILDDKLGASAEEITAFFLGVWREILLRSHFGAGCAVLAVTVATDSPDLLNHTATVFRAWRGRLAELLQQGGLTTRGAMQFAATLVAASEGAVVLSRAEQSMEPFDLVAEQLLDHVRTMTRRSSPRPLPEGNAPNQP